MTHYHCLYLSPSNYKILSRGHRFQGLSPVIYLEELGSCMSLDTMSLQSVMEHDRTVNWQYALTLQKGKKTLNTCNALHT